jgi:inhibitor of KinA sporulation pathway (predicted exonuclease)
MEIIEIGAVRLIEPDFGIADEFGSFVRPVAEPTLSEFCRELTSITQEQVDGAPTFGEILPSFLTWIGKEPFVLCSWGAYDLKQLTIDCRRHSLTLPEGFANHINLKQRFADRMRIRPCGMAGALSVLGLPLVGAHHRARDDVRNIAQIAQFLLREAAVKMPEGRYRSSE